MERLPVRAVRGVVALVATCALAVGCTDPDATQRTDDDAATSSTMTAPPTALVIDTDLAPDDLIALAFLLSSPQVEVRAVTVSGTGEVRCPAGLTVARGLLALTDHSDIPVGCGRTTPLAGDREFPQGWRDAADDGWGLDLPSVPAPSTERSAIDILTEALGHGRTTILTLGPATTVAELFRASPNLVDNVESIVMMGGAVDVPGNVLDEGPQPPVAEWNFYVDPTAAAEVMTSGAPVTLVGLDVTNRAPVTGDIIDLLRVNAHTPAASMVLNSLLNNPQVYEGGAYFWDPLAAGAVLDPGMLTLETTTLSVIVGDQPEAGRTQRTEDGQPVAVGVDVDVEAFEQMLVRTLDQLSADAALIALPAPTLEIDVRYLDGVCSMDDHTQLPAGNARLTFETDTAGWVGAVAPITSDLTDEQVIEWLETKDSSTLDDLGVGEVVMLFAVGGTRITIAPQRLIVVCGASDAVEIAGIITVEP